VTDLSVPLESIGPCLQGVFPSWLVTCSADGVPNATILSIVRYVDFERVALTRQFFNKTRANLDANPQAQVIVVDPRSGDQFALDLRYLHTESEGAIFDEVEANLAAVASQMGMTDVFRLRGVDIHRVLRCVPFGETAAPVEEPGADRDPLPLLDEFMRRLALCVDYADAARVGLQTLDDLFGFAYSILLTADERGDRLFAVSTNGYVPSGVGAEVPVGVGLVGVAAERRRVVCVPSLARSRAMNAAVQDSIRRSGAEPSAVEIELPGLDRVQSAAAIPLLARGELTGVLYLESERQGDFSPGKERLLRILGGQLAAALAVLEADRDESGPDESAPAAAPPQGTPLAVAYYQADDSVFVDDSYVVKGVPGRILWKLLGEHAADGRTSFSNRELRLDERLGLPAGNNNLEARLLVLRKRLAALECGITLDRVDRGRLSLGVSAQLTLVEVPTTGPMRAAHRPPADE
jgi:GAF domain/Pyridoxamine 5'-phosphate oxidase